MNVWSEDCDLLTRLIADDDLQAVCQAQLDMEFRFSIK
jgi:hypothetical protein